MKEKLFILISLIFAFTLIFEVYIYLLPLTNTPKKSDVIVILGCKVRRDKPTLFLRARTQQAITLYQQGYAHTIMVSGGKGHGERISEAEAERRILLQAGIPASHILVEDRSTNTASEMKYIKKIMQEQDLKTAIIVSNKFHLRRASILAKRNGIDATYSGVFVKRRLVHEICYSLREIPAIVKDWVVS